MNIYLFFFIYTLEGFEIKSRYVNARSNVIHINKSYRFLFEV